MFKLGHFFQEKLCSGTAADVLDITRVQTGRSGICRISFNNDLYTRMYNQRVIPV